MVFHCSVKIKADEFTVFGFIIFRDKEENSFMFLKQKRKVKENTELRQMSMVGSDTFFIKEELKERISE